MKLRAVVVAMGIAICFIGAVCSADESWSPWRNADGSDSIQYRFKVSSSGADAPSTCSVEVRNTAKKVVIFAVQANVTVKQKTGPSKTKRTVSLDKATQIGSDELENCERVTGYQVVAASK
jgi:type 1 fimbria pilin